jgi:16S rRNA (cytosine1402-N4)-methyltransferase
VLPRTLPLLKSEGRIAVISFHSLEDRIVKQFFRSAERPAEDPALQRLPLRAKDLPQPLLRTIGRAIKPGAAEIARNPRARSAVLRVAERTDTPIPPGAYKGAWSRAAERFRAGAGAAKPSSRLRTAPRH